MPAPTPVEIDGALVSFDPILLKGDPGAGGAQGAVGAVGATTNLTMGTIGTVPNGQAASASLTGTAPNQVLNLVLPAGPTGDVSSGSSLQETITYNGDGSVHTVTETASGAVTTYTYNVDGSVHTESRLVNGVTTVRTFSYDGSGNVIGIS